MCPECRKPLYGSASRGRHGGYYPAYHCDNRGHYFRKTKKEFDAAIEAFVKSLRINENYIEILMDTVGKAIDKQQIVQHQDSVTIDLHITELDSQIRATVNKMLQISSETALKYMEEEIENMKAEISKLEVERRSMKAQEPVDMEKYMAYVKYYLENFNLLLLNFGNPVLQARYFGVIFNQEPTYEDIVSGTPDITKITGVNEVFTPASSVSKTHG